MKRPELVGKKREKGKERKNKVLIRRFGDGVSFLYVGNREGKVRLQIIDYRFINVGEYTF